MPGQNGLLGSFCWGASASKKNSFWKPRVYLCGCFRLYSPQVQKVKAWWAFGEPFIHFIKFRRQDYTRFQRVGFAMCPSQIVYINFPRDLDRCMCSDRLFFFQTWNLSLMFLMFSGSSCIISSWSPWSTRVHQLIFQGCGSWGYHLSTSKKAQLVVLAIFDAIWVPRFVWFFTSNPALFKAPKMLHVVFQFFLDTIGEEEHIEKIG